MICDVEVDELPGETDTAAIAAGITKDPGGADLVGCKDKGKLLNNNKSWRQHAQTIESGTHMFIHVLRDVGDVEVGVVFV